MSAFEEWFLDQYRPSDGLLDDQGIPKLRAAWNAALAEAEEALAGLRSACVVAAKGGRIETDAYINAGELLSRLRAARSEA